MPTLALLLNMESPQMQQYSLEFTPRTASLKAFFAKLHEGQVGPNDQVEAMISSNIDPRLLETFNEAILITLKESIVQCQAKPPTTWSSNLLSYVSREDLKLLLDPENLTWNDGLSNKVCITVVLILSD